MAIEQQTTEAPGPSRRIWMRTAMGLWIVGLFIGARYALLYEFTPSQPRVIDTQWPAGTSCKLAPTHPTLIMFIHPRCPCSRASLSELATLMAHFQGKVETQVLFFQPQSAPADWAQTDLWQSAEVIPGVEARTDASGIEQQRFGARASGEAFLYQPDGELLFHGGITTSRGHTGDNAGRDLLEAILLRQQRTKTEAPVFGCQLQAACTLPRPATATAKTRQNP